MSRPLAKPDRPAPVWPTLPGRDTLPADPGPLPPAAVLAAAAPRGCFSAMGWRASSVPSMLRHLTFNSVEKMEGAGKMLGVLAVYADEERGPSLRFIAAGLLEQAHLLRAALQAERDLEKAEEAEQDAKRERARASKPVAAARPAAKGART